MKKTALRFALPCVAGALGAAAIAQETPGAASSADAFATETVQLSPFQVVTEADRGYQAINSLAGGRTNTPLRLTPSAISGMTRALIDDLAIDDVRESFFWTVNVAPGNQRQNETPFGDYEFNFRGTGSTGNYPTRNYFLYYGVGDSYNTERFEFARGPNSILFGDAQLGGVATTFTKVPRLDKGFTTAMCRSTVTGCSVARWTRTSA